MDTMRIEGLVVPCIIGVLDWERKRPQKIIIDLALEYNPKRAAKTDQLGDTINYTAVAKLVLQLAQKRKSYLLETLAEEIATLCLTNFPVSGVMVKIAKPSAIRSAKAASVEIVRRKR